MRGLIIEGIPGSGKTTLLRELAAFLAREHRGPLWVASEHVTERPLEPLAAADPETARRHLESHLDQLDRMVAWEEERFRNAGAGPIFLLERFHLSVALHVRGIEPAWMAAWEERLAALEIGLVLCELPPDRILPCTIQETVAARPPDWQRYLNTLAPDAPSQAEHFTREQRGFLDRYERSCLGKKRLEARGRPVAVVARETLDWMRE